MRRSAKKPLNCAVLALDHEVARRTPMMELRYRVVRVSRFGDPDGLEVARRRIPLSANSPTGSTVTAFSTFVSTRGLIRI
jgi:hypothetical protein